MRWMWLIPHKQDVRVPTGGELEQCSSAKLYCMFNDKRHPARSIELREKGTLQDQVRLGARRLN